MLLGQLRGHLQAVRRLGEASAIIGQHFQGTPPLLTQFARLEASRRRQSAIEKADASVTATAQTFSV